MDNQALFDAEGRPLESLKLFSLLRQGNAVERAPDAIEDSFLTVDLNGVIELPETVNAVMNDDSREQVPVTWSVSDAELAAMYANGPARYEIRGDAGGLEALCTVNMVEYNFLLNPDFELGDLTGWTLTDLGGADELYAEDKATDSLDGHWHMHFWSARQNSVEFTLEQEVTELRSGTYKFAISVMGGDAGESEVYAYAKIDGETVGTAPMAISGYGSWDTGLVEGIDYAEGQTLTVGVYVRCAGEGNGAWGKLDGAMLNSVS